MDGIIRLLYSFKFSVFGVEMDSGNLIGSVQKLTNFSSVQSINIWSIGKAVNNVAIAGVFGFIGFVKIHELPAEKILPYWFRHYFLFAKPIHYMSDEEYKLLHDKKNKRKISKNGKLQTMDKKQIKELRKKQKQEKLLMKAKKKYGITENTEIMRSNETEEKKEESNELAQKLSTLTKEEQEILLKLLGR